MNFPVSTRGSSPRILAPKPSGVGPVSGSQNIRLISIPANSLLQQPGAGGIRQVVSVPKGLQIVQSTGSPGKYLIKSGPGGALTTVTAATTVSAAAAGSVPSATPVRMSVSVGNGQVRKVSPTTILRPAGLARNVGRPKLVNKMHVAPVPRPIAPMPVRLSDPSRNEVASEPKVVRLKAKGGRPMMSEFFHADRNEIREDNADVVFICTSESTLGRKIGRVKAHKVVLAGASTFFTEIFQDQPIGETSTISVDGVPGYIIKLLVLLMYKQNVIGNERQMRAVRAVAPMFRINIDKLIHEATDGKPDVIPATVDILADRQVQIVRSSIKCRPSFTDAQRRSLMQQKRGSFIVNSVRPTLNPAVSAPMSQVQVQKKVNQIPDVETIVDDTDDNETAYTPENLLQMEHWLESVGAEEQAVNNWKRKEMEEKITEAKRPRLETSEDLKYARRSLVVRQRDAVAKTTAKSRLSAPEASKPFRFDPEEFELLNSKAEEIPMQTVTYSNTTKPTKSYKGLLSRITKSRGSESGNALDISTLTSTKWIYVCASCENFKETLADAMEHFRKCYPCQDVPFETACTKFRHGFYGNFKCPLCDRKFINNAGFIYHCSHSHPEYAENLRRPEPSDEKLTCEHCERKFATPQDFNEHLNKETQQCSGTKPTQDQEKDKTTADNVTKQSRKTTHAPTKPAVTPERSSKRRIVANPKYADGETELLTTTRTYTKQGRSTRVAKRASVAAVTATKEEEKPMGKRRNSATATAEVNFPPADCPACGATKVGNLTEHMNVLHEELGIKVSRVSKDLLRCRDCLSSFNIEDSITHSRECSAKGHNDKPEGNVSDEEPDISTKDDNDKPSDYMADVPAIPASVGTSPIDSFDSSILQSKEFLEKAFICPVCTKKLQKIGDVTLCLKSHGIFRCCLCFNTYNDKVDMQQHTKICHTVGSKYKCPLCDKLFSNAGQTASHLQVQHWEIGKKNVRKSAPLSITHESEPKTDNEATEKQTEVEVQKEPEESKSNEQSKSEKELEGDVSTALTEVIDALDPPVVSEESPTKVD